MNRPGPLRCSPYNIPKLRHGAGGCCNWMSALIFPTFILIATNPDRVVILRTLSPRPNRKSSSSPYIRTLFPHLTQIPLGKSPSHTNGVFDSLLVDYLLIHNAGAPYLSPGGAHPPTLRLRGFPLASKPRFLHFFYLCDRSRGELGRMQLSRAARIILVGAPGVGKGTQTQRLMDKFPQVSAISSGDLLRNNVRNRTPLGKN
jgi:hypothetical protein